MNLFWIILGLGLGVAVYRAITNLPMWSDDWFEFFLILFVAAGIGLFACLMGSLIVEEIDEFWDWKPLETYTISECVETVSTYDIKYYDPDMGYKELALPKEKCYINPLPDGEQAYVVAKQWCIVNETIDELFWVMTEKYAYSLFIPEGGN
jgi:hypothetical protein